jgi:hypothetical protein
MKLPLELIAMNHFLTNHVRGSRFEYLPKVCQDLNSDSPVFASANASAVAALARELKDPRIMSLAHDHYSRALALTNKALAIPQEAALDGTLISVLLLSLFETIAQENRAAPSNWTAHVQGAGALLALRGAGQFETPLGRELFTQVTTNVCTSSASRQVRVRPEIARLYKLGLPFMGPQKMSLRFSLIVKSFADMRASMAEMEIPDSAAIIETALDLEQQLCDVLTEVPPALQYKVVPADPKTTAYGPTVHEYPNHRVTQLFNSSRMMRIFLNELIYKQISIASTPRVDLSIDLMNDDWQELQDPTIDIMGDMDMDMRSNSSLFENKFSSPAIPQAWVKLQEQTARNIADLSMEICATVPQYAHSSPPPTVFTVAHLLWPLSSAAESFLCPPSVRTYIMDRLYFLGDQARFSQATWAAQMLEDLECPPDWCVYP